MSALDDIVNDDGTIYRRGKPICDAAAARSELTALRARVAELEGRGAKPWQPREGRCDICDWPLAESRDKGCVPGDCSYRPTEGTDEWLRIKARRVEVERQRAEHDRRNTGDGGNTDAAAAIHARTTEDVERPSPASPAQPAPASEPDIDQIIYEEIEAQRVFVRPAPASEREWTEEQRLAARDVGGVVCSEGRRLSEHALRENEMYALCAEIARVAPRFVRVKLPPFSRVMHDAGYDGGWRGVYEETCRQVAAALRAQGIEVAE